MNIWIWWRLFVFKFKQYTDNSWFGYTGNIFLKSLDGSEIIPTDLLLRESVQNSCDARKDPKKPVDFYMKGYHLTEAQALKLSQLLQDTNEKASIRLGEMITPHLFCVEVLDKGTVGLLGPYQQYDINGESIHSDVFNFRDFVLNMGGQKDGQSGGIFGIGKAAFFKVSKLKAVAIYTRTVYNNMPETRFIIRFFLENEANNLDKFWIADDNPNKYQLELAPYPFLNEKADSLAKILGMTQYSEDEFGTSVLIFDADLQDDSEDNGIRASSEDVFKNYIPKRIPHWFWPKMITKIPGEQIRFHLECDGMEIPILPPDHKDSPYWPFCEAYHCWKNRDPSDVDGLIEIKNPKVTVGYVTTSQQPFFMLNPEGIKELFNSDNNVCIAYMRGVELIVRYKNITVTGLENEYLFAMFHTDVVAHAADEEEGAVEKAFRDSENQTHDQWLPSQLRDRQKTYVRLGLRRIDEYLKNSFNKAEEPISSSSVSGILATSLGKFLPFGSGSGSSTSGSGSSGGGGGGRNRTVRAVFEMVGAPRYLDSEKKSREVVYRIKMKKRDRPLKPSLFIVMDDGTINNEVGLVSLVQIQYSPNKDSQIFETVLPQKDSYLFDKDGFYYFTFKTNGNLVFECKLME